MNELCVERGIEGGGVLPRRRVTACLETAGGLAADGAARQFIEAMARPYRASVLSGKEPS